MIKLKYLKIIDGSYKARPGGIFWVSIDAASATSDTADYSAISLGYSNADGHHLLFADHGRWDYETLKGKAVSYLGRFPDLTFIVEYASVGVSLVNYLRKSEVRCFHYVPKTDKVVRVARVLPIFEAGRVYIRSIEGRNDWVDPYINELVSFPNGRFDDQVDSLVQAISWVERRVNSGGGIYFI